MAKLHIVCPSCGTKYPVADQKLAGRRVTCKKCSQKFVAEIQGAAPPPEEEPLLIPASAPDPLGDDLFGDIPTSEPALSGPALGTLPPKQNNSSSGSFSVVPVLLGMARVTGVTVVVVIAFSTLYPVAGSGQGAPRDRDVSGGQFGPGPSRGEGAFAPPRGPGGARDEGIYVPPHDGTNQSQSQQPGPPPQGQPFGPLGQGGRPPGMPGGPGFGGRDLAKEAISRMEQEFGADKLVRLECESISREQAKEIYEILKQEMIAHTHVHWFDPNIRQRVFTFPYDGDVRELASKITFGEVDEVLVSERRIRLKSITLP
ncbi:hypothetical protein Pan97_30400 [Bremerella volcania]|uniref:Zinc finger/thioredoxin putative domain-containing protein n=1 Tax=Bremerella volcania TaxID=2527984 RepID=A0A518C9U5_9BACT|nr:zinc-ribbon domain-containing protein [Bremerella volcania]QDU75995.1 hypothetical protein Pan97_30400 [Bremerella volcania]